MTLRLIAHRRDLDAVLGVLVGIVDPAVVPLAAGDRLDVADDLRAAGLAVRAVLQPHDAAAQIGAAVGDLDGTAAGVVDPQRRSALSRPTRTAAAAK